MKTYETFVTDNFNSETIESLGKNKYRHLIFRNCPEKKFDLTKLLIYKNFLEKLSLQGNDYINLEIMINEMSKLIYLNLDTLKIDFSLITENSVLEYLGSEGSKTKEWNDIIKLKKLKDLYINGNITLENIDFLSKLKNLEKIRLFNCSKIIEIPDLSSLTKLKSISFEMCNRLENIDELKKIKNVEIHVSGKIIKGGYHIHLDK
jgi:hypothetical protein